MSTIVNRNNHVTYDKFAKIGELAGVEWNDEGQVIAEVKFVNVRTASERAGIEDDIVEDHVQLAKSFPREELVAFPLIRPRVATEYVAAHEELPRHVRDELFRKMALQLTGINKLLSLSCS